MKAMGNVKGALLILAFLCSFPSVFPQFTCSDFFQPAYLSSLNEVGPIYSQQLYARLYYYIQILVLESLVAKVDIAVNPKQNNQRVHWLKISYLGCHLL